MLRLSKVDDLIRSDHYYLSSTDKCLFLREYIPRVGFSGGETNSLISNFKKGMERRGSSEWIHKGRAIRRIADELYAALNKQWLELATLVPIPCSKTRQNPLHDDRMTQVLKQILADIGENGDVRELVIQRSDMEASHTTEIRPSPHEIRLNYSIDETLTVPSPAIIGLFDDVLTTGAHFRAASDLLADRFPDVPIVGIFVARRIIP